MTYIKRVYENLNKHIKAGKVLIIYGPRRVGKTTLVKRYFDGLHLNKRYVTGDDIIISNLLSSRNLQRISEFVENFDLLVIDEAQNIKDIGMALKLIVDNFPEKKIIATGSSSFDLIRQVGEPLTGRKRVLMLLPIWQGVLYKNVYNKYELKERLEDFLIFGSYPEVLLAKSKKEKIEILREIVGSYLLKDILAFEKVRNSKKLFDLLRLLAFQVGSEVSKNELSNTLGIDSKSVERYLDLLEKSFVIKRLEPFSTNRRKTISKKGKYFFLDNGIRNAVISNFNELENRDDTGALFENFVIMERIKKNIYSDFYGNIYFWRAYRGGEVDFVEEYDGKLYGYEVKFSSKRRVSSLKEWERIKNSSLKVISTKNYLDFVI